MSSEAWPTLALESVAEVVSGQSPTAAEMNDKGAGYPFFQGSRDFGIRFPTPRVFTESPRRTADAGDILLSVRAPIGRVNRAQCEVAIGRGLFAVRGKPETCRTDFLEYFLSSIEAMWDAHASGGAVFSNLSRAGLLSVQVPVPSLGEQSAIAEVLGALDERIEWCMSASTALIDLAETFWAQAAEINGLNTTVGDVTIFLNRRRVPLSAQERATRPGPYPYYGATGVFDSVDDFLFDGNYVLVGEDGSVVNGDGTPFVQYATGRFWVNNHAHVLESQTLEPEELYLALRRTIVAGYVTGAAQPKLSMGRLREVPLRIPASEAVARVREAIASMFSLYRELGAEADTLRRTRGALLPKLVSGELRIADPDALLEPIQ